MYVTVTCDCDRDRDLLLVLDWTVDILGWRATLSHRNAEFYIVAYKYVAVCMH